MGTDGPGILHGSFQMDLQCTIVGLCNLDLGKFFDNEENPKKNILTKKIFEKNFNKILGYIDAFEGTVQSLGEKRLAYQVLGYFVLLTGAEIRENIKEMILTASDYEYEKDIWPDFWKEDRKFCLNELREKIKNHKPSKVEYLTPY